MSRTRRSRAVHKTCLKHVKIHGRKNPGICLDCGQFVNNLYQPNGIDRWVCYPCKKENY